MFVGEKTNKIVAFNCYDRSCSLCDKHGLRNHQGPCNSTFEGTAKSMEPVGMTDCIRDVTITRGHNISEIIVDNDGNTTDAIQVLPMGYDLVFWWQFVYSSTVKSMS